MPKFICWYKKEIEASNVKEAILKESKVKSKFHSLEHVKEEKEQGMSAIGFEIDTDNVYYTGWCKKKKK